MPGLWPGPGPSRAAAGAVALQAAGAGHGGVPGVAGRPGRGLAHRAVLSGGSIAGTGCGAGWLARLTGGQEVAGSNPASPT